MVILLLYPYPFYTIRGLKHKIVESGVEEADGQRRLNICNALCPRSIETSKFCLKLGDDYKLGRERASSRCNWEKAL